MDAISALERLLHVEAAPHASAAPPSRKPVLTLAFDEGSDGLAVAQAVATYFDVPLYDKQFLHSIATATGIDEALLARLDDRYQPRWNDWLLSFRNGLDVAHVRYYRHLINCLLAVVRNGGVIVGRGANVALAQHPVFRVRVVGSTDYCARRLVNGQGLSYADALARIEQVNQEKARFVWEYFHRRHNDPTLFDLMINSDRFANAQQVAEVIQCAMQQSGFAGSHE